MTRWIGGCLVVCLMGLGACAGDGAMSQSAPIERVSSAKELKALMDGGSVVVVHALDAENYAKAHVPGAINVDYEKMQASDLPENKSQKIVFYCAGGMCPVARMAANKAGGWGYTNLVVYSGGIKDWQASGMEVATGK